MKKILTILGTITLIGTSTTNLVACNIPQEYTAEELEHLKEENKINTTDETIRDNLEWIAPQEKPFDDKNNKWYYIVWKKQNWVITKTFKDYSIEAGKEYNIYKDDNYELKFFKYPENNASLYYYNNDVFREWGQNDYKNYIKSVYRWNLNTTKPNLIVDDKGNIKQS